MKINTFSFLTFLCAVILIGLSGLEVFGQDVNLALKANNSNVTAKQSSVNEWKEANLKGTAEHAVDGDTNGGGLAKIAETSYQEPNNQDSWFEVDLGGFYKIHKIVIHPRTDCCQDMFKSAYIIVADQAIGAVPMVDEGKIKYFSSFSNFYDPIYEPGNKARTIETNKSIGRFVRVQIKGWGAIQLAEIEVFGDPTPVAGYTPNPAKAWNAVLRLPFDPNYPNFLGVTQATNDAYYGTLQSSPKIVVAKNSATSFDIAYQDLYDTKIRINTYEKSGTGFKKNAAESTEAKGLGTFAGFAKDAGKNRYVFTSEPWTGYEQQVNAEVVKIPAQGSPDVIWKAKYFDGTNIVNGVKSLMNGFFTGTSRLVAGGNSLLITTNIFPAHPYQVILDTQDKPKNDNRAFFESAWHHNFGQRAMFDGNDFVVMENRDHDVTVTLTKLKSSEVLPLTTENKDHAGKYAARIFSVYSHTNFANHTYTELGNVEKGFNDNNGYLVLFASERDWNDKMKGFRATSETIKTWSQDQILSPRDIGLVHVKKDFNKSDPNDPNKLMVNWLNAKGDWMTQCPQTVDNSNFVNSSGTTKTVTYDTANDGWDWVKYAPGSGCENAGKRSLVTKGVKWVTNYGSTYEAGKKKAAAGEVFTSVNHPKLVRIAQNKYVAVWEEWNAKSNEPMFKYVTTKAALITLKAAPNGEVDIELTSTPKDMGSVRLMPGDDAFEFDGKAAWAVGDVAKGKLVFYTIDAALNLASYDLEL